MWNKSAAIAAVLLAACLPGACAEPSREITADTFHVLRVVDGDTFVIRYDGEPTSVRLWGIDAPERSDPDGPAAAAELRRLIDDRQVRLVLPGPRKRDNFGRLLARVYVDRPDDQAGPVEVSQAMLTANLAVAYEGSAAITKRRRKAGSVPPASSPSLGIEGR